MLYNNWYITFPKWLYNIQIWLYNIRDGYITHPNLPDVGALSIKMHHQESRALTSPRHQNFKLNTVTIIRNRDPGPGPMSYPIFMIPGYPGISRDNLTRMIMMMSASASVISLPALSSQLGPAECTCSGSALDRESSRSSGGYISIGLSIKRPEVRIPSRRALAAGLGGLERVHRRQPRH